jgi:hypothetical protein
MEEGAYGGRSEAMTVTNKKYSNVVSIILEAKHLLMTNNVPGPYSVYLSPAANEALLDEIEKREGKRHSRVIEVCGMIVKIDPDCPPQGAYVTGEKP